MSKLYVVSKIFCVIIICMFIFLIGIIYKKVFKKEIFRIEECDG